jgi:DNA invertase Pin-like site-specific DNA recombinase
MKAAIYARVSTDEQNPKNQVEPLRSFAQSLDLEIVEEYIDVVSGGDSNRPGFKRLLAGADAHKFDIILIWALDRFSREGILNTLAYLKRLKNANVSLRSLKESWLNTSDEGMGQLLIAIFSWVAAQERQRLSERTKEGLRGKQNVGKRGPDKKPRKRGGYYLRYSPHLKDATKQTVVSLHPVSP